MALRLYGDNVEKIDPELRSACLQENPCPSPNFLQTQLQQFRRFLLSINRFGIFHGRLNVSVREFLIRLREAGLGILPGTAAEILDDEMGRITA